MKRLTAIDATRRGSSRGIPPEGIPSHGACNARHPDIVVPDRALRAALASALADLGQRLEAAVGQPITFVIFAGRTNGEPPMAVATNSTDPPDMMAAVGEFLEAASNPPSDLLN
jgi:hypothetical protein